MRLYFKITRVFKVEYLAHIIILNPLGIISTHIKANLGR